MRSVGVREFKAQVSRILQEVKETGEGVEITRHGQVIARIVPPSRGPSDREEFERIWAEMDRLAEEIGQYWPAGVTAAEAVSEERREL